MSPPVITWFFNPALALWPSPHDEAEATGGIEGAIVSDLERASPARIAALARAPLHFVKGAGRLLRLLAFPVRFANGDGVDRLACTAEPALTLRIRTLQLQAPS